MIDMSVCFKISVCNRHVDFVDRHQSQAPVSSARLNARRVRLCGSPCFDLGLAIIAQA
jgi:hypothetical protein